MVHHTRKKVREREKVKAHCQCMASCTNPPLKNSPFCAKHLRFCPRKSPLSGYEPDFNPDKYNKFLGMKEAQNCFAYAFDYTHLPKRKDRTKDSCPIPFPQPGRANHRLPIERKAEA